MRGGPVDALEQVVHGLAVVGDIVFVVGGTGQAGAVLQRVDEVDFEAVAAVGLHQVFDRAIGVLAHHRAAGTEEVVCFVGVCSLETVRFYEGHVGQIADIEQRRAPQQDGQALGLNLFDEALEVGEFGFVGNVVAGVGVETVAFEPACIDDDIANAPFFEQGHHRADIVGIDIVFDAVPRAPDRLPHRGRRWWQSHFVHLVVGAREGAHLVEDGAVLAGQVERLFPDARLAGSGIEEALQGHVGVFVVAAMTGIRRMDVVHKAHAEAVLVKAV